MERRFSLRLQELRSDAEVDPRVMNGLLARLEQFLEPFVERLQRSEQRHNAQRYVAGLISDLEAKNAESIAYLHDQDRQPLQNFIGQSPWDHRPLLSVLGEQVASQLGAADAVLVFDPSAFAKKGTASVGVQRQWCGRLGKVENCQVGIYLGYVSRLEHALVDVRLYRWPAHPGDPPPVLQPLRSDRLLCVSGRGPHRRLWFLPFRAMVP